jgi:hypothetical protein
VGNDIEGTSSYRPIYEIKDKLHQEITDLGILSNTATPHDGLKL